MSKKHLFAALVVALGASAAMAQGTSPDTWARFNEVPLPSAKSRAEVLAELEIYRRSGLAELERVEGVDYFGHRHRVASARYAAMRVSPEFASLVLAIAERRGEQPGGTALAAR